MPVGQWVTGHRCDGSHGSWVTKDDPLSALVYKLGHFSLHHFKTQYFQQAFQPTERLPPAPQDSTSADHCARLQYRPVLVAYQDLTGRCC